MSAESGEELRSGHEIGLHRLEYGHGLRDRAVIERENCHWEVRVLSLMDKLHDEAVSVAGHKSHAHTLPQRERERQAQREREREAGGLTG